MADVAEQVVYRTRTDCRLCGSTKLEQVWSFGQTPLANNYVTPQDAADAVFEPMAPLDISYCQDCHLVQLVDVVDPDLLFKHYLYVSSTSASFVKHFENYAKALLERFLTHPLHTSPSSEGEKLVIDVGSNDGILLRPLQASGVRVLGIDPAENVAAAANAAGIPTIPAYFTPEVASQIKAQHGPATVISANNVFAHTDDIHTFVSAVKELLAPEGVFVFEVQYLKDLVEKNLFDIVYHEHTNYYHVTPLNTFFEQQGMQLFDVERVPVHGGSIRVFVTPSVSPLVRGRTTRLVQLLQEEEDAGLNTATPYHAFADRIEANKQKLRALIDSIKSAGKTIAGYGAPAKATTLMYAFGLTGDDISFIVDDAPLKQGRLMPGTHVAIYGPDMLYGKRSPAAPLEAGAMGDTPDYCVIMAWNFADQIMKTHERFAHEGGKWIVPVPEPRVV